ncbi:MAG: Hsp20/alpha crystallin family protein [Candidatus Aminicenantes bacterium]
MDVFKEAEEVQIIVDLGNFRKGDLDFGLENRKYFISGKHKDCEFRQEISLPYDVDIAKIKENFKNDILQLILPKKRRKERRSKKDEK